MEESENQVSKNDENMSPIKRSFDKTKCISYPLVKIILVDMDKDRFIKSEGFIGLGVNSCFFVFTVTSLLLSLRARNLFAEGSNLLRSINFLAVCETGKLETANEVNFISLCLLTTLFSTIYILIFSFWAGVGEYNEFFWETLFQCIFMGYVIYKFCWCISFAIFYAQEVSACLQEEDDDPVFDELHLFLKPILGIEMIALTILIMSLTFLCIACCCFPSQILQNM